MPEVKENTIEVRIYYEDTDSLGLVYYANYLKYMERGRTELVGAQGKPIGQWNTEGYNFAVFEVKIRYLKPARLGDVCQVVSAFSGGTDFRRIVKQRVERDGVILTEATVHLVCLDDQMELREFPPELMIGP